MNTAERCLSNNEAFNVESDRRAAARWMAAMFTGDFETAWQQSDAIRRRGAPDSHSFWQGESLIGKRVILRCLHGFGDTVQFLSYLPLLQSLAAHVIIEVPPRFVELARCFRGIGDVMTWGENAPAMLPEWDVQVEVMELPYIFRTQLCELPTATSYLQLPFSAARCNNNPRRLRVGLMWTAGSWNSARAIPFSVLRPVIDINGCEFWNLQHESDTCKEIVDTHSLRQDAPSSESLMGLAQLIARLDLIITVDTVAAHLAGALGVEAWTLLQHQADWRWMEDRTDSPWYPSLRLFRQPSPGDWPSVVASVCRELQARATLRFQEIAA